MSLREDFERMFEDVNQKRLLWNQKAENAAKSRFSQTSVDVYNEFGEYQRQKITTMFNQAVQAFYLSYTPHVYKRTGSLYNLLQLSFDERNLVEYDKTIDLIDPDRMHRDRHGNNSLFDTVFMEGWHGGAKTISDGAAQTWGVHPSPGVAYYRTRGNVTYPDTGQTKSHRYGKWGSVAFRSEAPYKIFDTNLQAAETNDFASVFQKIAQKNWNTMCNNLQDDLSRISQEIYG